MKDLTKISTSSLKATITALSRVAEQSASHPSPGARQQTETLHEAINVRLDELSRRGGLR